MEKTESIKSNTDILHVYKNEPSLENLRYKDLQSPQSTGRSKLENRQADVADQEVSPWTHSPKIGTSGIADE